MKKRIMALLLVLAMAVSMISCGGSKETESKNATADVTALFDKAEGMEARTADFTMDMTVSGKEASSLGNETIKLGAKISCVTQDDKKSQATISYKLGDSSDYKELTTVIGDDKTAYIDFATLKTAVVDICNTYKQSQAAAMISVLPDATYLKVDADTLNKYISSVSGTEINTASLTDADTKTSEQVVRTVVQYVMKTIQDETKEVSPALVSGSDSELKFNVTKDNLAAVSEAILKLDLNAKYDEMVQKVKEIGNTDQYVTDISKSKEEVVSGIKDALNEIKNEKEDFDVFNIDGTIGVTGDKGTRKLTEKVSANIEQKDEKVSFTMDLTCGEEAAKDVTVTIPSDTTDFVEYMTQLSSLLGY